MGFASLYPSYKPSVIEIRQERGVDDLELGAEPILHRLRPGQAVRRPVRDGALHGMMVDAGNLEQRIEAGLAVVAILDFGEVDGLVELSDRPAELDMRRLGSGCGKRSEQGGSEGNANG